MAAVLACPCLASEPVVCYSVCATQELLISAGKTRTSIPPEAVPCLIGDGMGI